MVYFSPLSVTDSISGKKQTKSSSQTKLLCCFSITNISVLDCRREESQLVNKHTKRSVTSLLTNSVQTEILGRNPFMPIRFAKTMVIVKVGKIGGGKY